MNLSKNNGFTVSDIERYHSGKMSPQERHALEKAALDDPFLADALEGYAFTSTPADDLSKIQSRLDEKLNRKKVVPFFQKYKWLSAAAIVFIIGGAAWLTSIVSSQQKSSVSIAQKKEKPIQQNNPVSPNKNVPDSSGYNLVDNTNAEKQLSQKKEEQKLPSNQKKNNHIAAKKSKQNKEDEQKFSSNTETFSIAANNKKSSRLEEVPISKVPEVQTNKISDAQARQTFLKSRSNTDAPPTNDTIKSLNIVLQPLPMDSAKLVVIDNSPQKKLKNKYPVVTIDTLEPAEGYTNFDDYVANNLKMPEEFKDKPASGEVQLSFDVDENGKPTNITVVKSLCQKCDEEAIRLLKEGPKWKKKKNKKGRITIKF